MNPLPIAKLLYLEIYGILLCVLTILLRQTLRDGEGANIRRRIFVAMVGVVTLTILAEATAWLLDGDLGTGARRILLLTDALDNLLTPVPGLLWLCYVTYHITRDRRRLRNVGAFVTLLFAGSALLIFSPRTRPLFFVLDRGAHYQRGPWLMPYMLLSVGVLVCTDIFILLARHALPRREGIALLGFSLPALAGPALQVLVYGLSTTMVGITLSLLLLYIDLQSQLRGTDYLTGLANRRQLDAHVEYLLSSPHPRRPVALIMMDMDHLKTINDTWGHTMGDRAIEQCAVILRKCFHHNDLLARFAGDEFVAVLELDDSSDIRAVMTRLAATVTRWGTTGEVPFTIHLSAGYALYPDEGARTPLALYHQADQRMYAAKKAAYSNEKGPAA